ncbi:hypothetical protein [Mycolicibacterium sphagni]|uniref:hypothetical protein n=1 Tax=Mycolicibacterium sphagni TaxID=1786 RepID=UPI0021F3BA8C|nr:hypothetical protein [Mycolicibacterium sphagni]MCV7175792.1 hypothetical protein [Mycolicibacterium sphagni]
MRRGIGAIFTTGVALVGATVVVANPVSAPPSDARVPAVKLSAGSASPAALDRALLEAIAQDSAASSPATPFKKLLAGAVADVTLFSGAAVEKAFLDEAVDATPLPAPHVSPAAVADLLSVEPVTKPAATVSAPVIDDLRLQHAVTSVADYVGYVSTEVVEATVAAGTMGAAEPKLMSDTLTLLSHGDVDSAISAALRAVATPLGAPLTTVEAIRAAVRQRLTELADLLRRPVQHPPKTQAVRAAVSAIPRSRRALLGHRRGSAVTTQPAAATTSERDAPKPTTVNGGTDLTNGNKAVPRKEAAHAGLRQRGEASLNQARTSLQRLGDVLRKAITPHRPHHH